MIYSDEQLVGNLSSVRDMLLYQIRQELRRTNEVLEKMFQSKQHPVEERAKKPPARKVKKKKEG